MPVEVILPKVDMAMEEGSIEAWAVEDGATVREGDTLFEVMTDKAVMAVDAPAAGRVWKMVEQTGVKLPIGTVVALIYPEGEAEPPRRDRADAPAPQPPAVRASAEPPGRDRVEAPGPPARLRATPLARRLAAQRGVDLAAVAASGPNGRVQRIDVERAAAAAATPVQAPPSPPAAEGGSRLVPLSPVRRTTAARLAESARTAPHFFMSAEMDMAGLLDLRALIAPRIERRRGVKPSLTVLLARIIGAVLPGHPLLNARLEGDRVRLFDAVHLGIAIDRDGDLLVPVLRDAHRASIEDLTVAFARLSGSVRDRSAAPADLTGSTFTLSNLGMYGVDAFTAIINPPESAILAVGRIAEKPVGRDGAIVLRQTATFSLSSDHRIVDGVAAGRFMADLREAVENPVILL